MPCPRRFSRPLIEASCRLRDDSRRPVEEEGWDTGSHHSQNLCKVAEIYWDDKVTGAKGERPFRIGQHFFPISRTEAYDPPAVHTQSGDDYEETVRSSRCSVSARTCLVRAGALHRRSCVARSTHSRETHPHGRVPNQSAEIHQAVDRK